MSRPIIIAENLGKRYDLGFMVQKIQIGGWASSNFTLREAIARTLHSGLRRIARGGGPAERPDHSFWALRDVSFEVQQGEVVGLIGRNGAGKSTLLKVFSRIVEPTEGMVRLRGRIASLLEVGTGFHPELTGRENIYLNGAMMGMRRAEIARKFDEIVAFSEIEKFLETPVKRYSSGMYVRLAFAVAAHLEPEILIVDEVLAVGDQAFQKKCLGKMHDVATSGGRTVLFVSHNMGALTQLCQHGVLLEHGRITTIGPVRDVIQTYLRSSLDDNASQARFPTDPAKPSQFVSAEVLHDDGGPGSEFSCDEPVTFRIRYEVRQPVAGTFLTFSLQNLEGTRVLYSDIRDTDPEAGEHLEAGLHAFEITTPARLLAPTTYLLSLGSASQYSGAIDHQHTCCEFTLRDFSTQQESRPGVLGIQLAWEHKPDRSAVASAPSTV
jgi:lipopolysaccharide transport system ATP-binding protein